MLSNTQISPVSSLNYSGNSASASASSIPNNSNNSSSLGSSLGSQLNSASSDISTIFIIGFPDDFKERELTNMFLFAPGFEGAVLKATAISTCPAITLTPVSSEESQRKQLIGFVKFSKAAEAIYALEILNGRILDQERGIVVKAELAKKNLFVKASAINEEDQSQFNGCSCNSANCLSCNASKREKGNRVMSITLPGQSDPAIICAPVKMIDNSISNSSNSVINPNVTIGIIAIGTSSPAFLAKSPLNVPDRIIDLCALQRNLIASPSLGSMAAIVGENFPCNTLYVGNLPPVAQEDELRALFRNCLGYRRLSFRPKASGPMCFVEFEDIACATAAMETLYGTMISCSSPVKGGIRLSFSKNPLGLRVASPVSSTATAATVTTSTTSFMEAIGAETDNPDHRQAIAIIFAHYHKNKPYKKE